MMNHLMNNRKGFSLVFIIIVIALIIVAGAVIWYFTSRQSTPSLSAVSNPTMPPSSSPTTSVTTAQNIATTTAAWKIYQNAQYGLTIKYPNDLYPQSIDSGDIQAGIFLDLESAPNGVAIGGAFPAGSPVATSGFAIVIAATPYTSSGTYNVYQYTPSSTFNINQYLANNGPMGQRTVPIMIGNIPGYEVVSFLPPDTSGNQPLGIIFHNGIVYQIGYGSTNYDPDFSDKQGFNDFNFILKNFIFTN
jgi:hypothetical protein